MLDERKRAEWNRALGRLPDSGKAQFIELATQTLARAQRGRGLSKEHVRALLAIADRSERLNNALARAKRLGLPDAYVRNAWRVTTVTGDDDTPFLFPDMFPALLARLAASARKFLPDAERPKGRPREH